jgi:hypothetical protein
MTNCPHCGHPVSDVDTSFVGIQLLMFKILKSAGSAGITKAFIFERIYGNRADGGPQSNRTLNIYRIRMRERLAECGLKIETVRRGGRGVSSTWRLRSIGHDDVRDHQHGAKADLHHPAKIVHAGPKA